MRSVFPTPLGFAEMYTYTVRGLLTVMVHISIISCLLSVLFLYFYSEQHLADTQQYVLCCNAFFTWKHRTSAPEVYIMRLHN